MVENFPKATDALIVHIVDDDAANREVLQDLFDSVDLPWRSHASGQEFLDALSVTDTGCVVLDVRMPRMSGIQLLEKLKEDGVRLPIIMATAHGDVPMAIQAMKLGASDFLEKPLNHQQVLEAVHRALDRRSEGLVSEEKLALTRANYEKLTTRERDVYGQIVDGAMNKQAAHALGISQRTIEVHRASMMEKMEAANLAELMRMHLVLFPEP